MCVSDCYKVGGQHVAQFRLPGNIELPDYGCSQVHVYVALLAFFCVCLIWSNTSESHCFLKSYLGFCLV